jgi:hypothetical protein
MNTLERDLIGFATAIAGDNAADHRRVGGISYDADIALEVYRNNYRGNLHDALAGAYPVIENLVGAAFFRRLTLAYISDNHSRSGNLHRYGEQMAAFVTTFEPAQQLAYLPDVAALEWACHCAYFADEADAFAVGKLAEIPAERYAELVFCMHPSVHLVHSRFPVAEIWHAHQPGAPEDFHIDLEIGSCNALVVRQNNEVRVLELDNDEFTWLSEIRRGAALGIATGHTLAAHAEFNLPATLAKLATLGCFSDISLKEQL